MSWLIVHTDGGARGNPGPSAIGVFVKKDEQTLLEQSAFLGVQTNNEAEYWGFKKSLEWISQFLGDKSIEGIEWRLDSMLVVEQLNKKWKIKEERLRVFANEIWSELAKLSVPYKITHVPRAQNSQADALVNQCLDSQS